MKIDLENNKKLYYSIKEVAAHFGVNESLLRFWETEFKEIKPKKTSTGIRQYTREDIGSIALIYSLVREKGLTLEGARQTLRVKKDEEVRRLELRNRLEYIKKELTNLKDAFDNI